MVQKKETIRRGDEESLYYILERDLDRGALFPENDGWFPQVKTTEKRGYKIDYVVEYDKKLIGIEVKYDFPKQLDFDQVKEQYEPSLNAVFLAYPSDRVGEAVSFIERDRSYRNYGLLSLALFRSHCIKKARLRESRYDEYVWKNYFDKEKTINSIIKKPSRYCYKKDLQRVIIELNKKPGKSVLTDDDWRLLCLILNLYDIYGYNKFFAWEGESGIQRTYLKIFNRYPSYPSGLGLVYAGLITDYSYGTRLTMLSLTDEALYHRQKIEQVLAERYPRAFKKVKKIQSEWKQNRRIKQRETKNVFFE
jgi:hypothetical protein